MPIYEYECKSCGHRLETIQGFNDVPLTDCPSCEKAALAKLLSAPAFHLKGNGWYVTDFKNPSQSTCQKESSAATGTATDSCGTDECKAPAKETDKATTAA